MNSTVLDLCRRLHVSLLQFSVEVHDILVYTLCDIEEFDHILLQKNNRWRMDDGGGSHVSETLNCWVISM